MADTYNHQVVHLASDGNELWRGDSFLYPISVSVNAVDGSCWVGCQDCVVHLAADGTELGRIYGFDMYWAGGVAVNPTDGSCWVANAHGRDVVHLASDCSVLWWGEGFLVPFSVSVNPNDESCWVADTYNNRVVHLAEDGGELVSIPVYRPLDVSVNVADGSCWVGGGGAVLHLASDGSELGRSHDVSWCYSVSANDTDGSCWVADGRVLLLAEDCTALWVGGGGATWALAERPTAYRSTPATARAGSPILATAKYVTWRLSFPFPASSADPSVPTAPASSRRGEPYQ